MASIDLGGLQAGIGAGGAGVSLDGGLGAGLGLGGSGGGGGGGGVGVSLGQGAGANVNANIGGLNAGAGGGGVGVSLGQGAQGAGAVNANVGGLNAGAGGGGVGVSLGQGAQGAGAVNANVGGLNAGAGGGGVGVSLGEGAGSGQANTKADIGDAGVGVSIGSGAGAGQGEASGEAQVNALAPLPNPGSGAACTVQGGPARLLYLPPAAAGAQAPEVTAYGNTFNPDYCYLSFSTLYATLSGSTVGPTFSNALIPFKTSEVSTACGAQATGAGGAASQFSLEGMLGTGHKDSGCNYVVAPPRIGEFIPAWDNARYWNVSFEQPQVILPKNPPADCKACAAPAYSPTASSAYPTMCNQGYPSNYAPATATAPPGVSTASYGQSAATRYDVSSYTITGSPTSPIRSFGTNVSPANASSAQPAAYTGAAALTTASSGRLGLLVGLVPLLLALM